LESFIQDGSIDVLTAEISGRENKVKVNALDGASGREKRTWTGPPAAGFDWFVADLEGAGKSLCVLCSNAPGDRTHLHVLGRDGVSRHPLELAVLETGGKRDVRACDLDGNGKEDLVFVSPGAMGPPLPGNTVRAVRGLDGKPIWDWRPQDASYVPRLMAIQ